MNFSFGNWENKKAIFSRAMIIRAAAHLLGHALGLYVSTSGSDFYIFGLIVTRSEANRTFSVLMSH